MNTNKWVILAVGIALGTPGWAAEGGAKPKAETKPKPAKAALAESKPAEPEPVFNPEPAVARQNNVNVRGQAAISSEVVTRLQKDQPITLLEEITLRKPKADEPAKWYRIVLPATVPVWVHSDFINVTNKTVLPNRLNVRSGPGENYSILGRLSKGAVVKELQARGEWIRIEPPTNAFAFVAAHLVTKVAPTPTPTTPAPPVVTPVAVVPTPTPVTEQPKPAVDQPAPTPPPATPAPVAAVPPPTVTLAPATPGATEPLPKRVVRREGWVRRTASPHAPTYFELESRDTKRIVNYVYSPVPEIDIKKLKGRLIQVTGEESLDERWPNTPVITVETLEILF